MCRTKIFLAMIFNEIECHVNTSLGLVGGMHPLHPPLCLRLDVRKAVIITWNAVSLYDDQEQVPLLQHVVHEHKIEKSLKSVNVL